MASATRAVARVDAAEGDEPPVGRRGGRERDVVGRRVAVGLVHREHDAARSGAAEHVEQLLRGLREAVRIVGADVGVRVEQRELADLGDQPVVVRLQDPVDVDHEPGRL